MSPKELEYVMEPSKESKKLPPMKSYLTHLARNIDSHEFTRIFLSQFSTRFCQFHG